MSFILLIIGFITLVKCADLFVDNCSILARFLGIPTLIIGLTVVAMGTSAPEASVSIIASLQGNSSISVGNIVGSNICNMLLILGLSSLFVSLTTKKKIITRDFIYLIISCLLLLGFLAVWLISGHAIATLTSIYGIIMLIIFIVYMGSLLLDAKKSAVKDEEQKVKFRVTNLVLIIIGLAGIIIGGQIVVNAASDIAKLIGLSDSIIALTIVAIGTSLPELVTSVVAAKKGETDMAIGNIVGSNIFNILFILGISSIVNPLTIDINSFIDVIIMTLISLLMYVYIFKKKTIDKQVGIIMLMSYVLYIVYIVIR